MKGRRSAAIEGECGHEGACRRSGPSRVDGRTDGLTFAKRAFEGRDENRRLTWRNQRRSGKEAADRSKTMFPTPRRDTATCVRSGRSLRREMRRSSSPRFAHPAIRGSELRRGMRWRSSRSSPRFVMRREHRHRNRWRPSRSRPRRWTMNDGDRRVRERPARRCTPPRVHTRWDDGGERMRRR
jgi:hypothetical protein